MSSDLVNSINLLAENIRNLNLSTQATFNLHWWDTQWFSAVIGATTGFIGTYIFSTLKDRNQRLFEYYQWFLKQGTFSDPTGLLKQASIISYGVNDKPLGEKMVIELRSHTKYWYEPISKFRFLMKSYENSILKINGINSVDVKAQPQFKEAEIKFKKIMDYIYKKTGESEWTS